MKPLKQEFLKNTIVIYRPHPWGGGGHNGKEIIKSKMETYKNRCRYD